MTRKSHLFRLIFVPFLSLGACDHDTPSMMMPPGIKYLDVSNVADVTPDGRYALLQDMESPMGTVLVYDAYLDKLDMRGAASNPDPAMGDTTKGTPNPPQGAFGISA